MTDGQLGEGAGAGDGLDSAAAAGGGGGGGGGGAGGAAKRAHVVDVRTFAEMFVPAVTNQTVRNWIRLSGMPIAKVVPRGTHYVEYWIDPVVALEWVRVNKGGIFEPGIGPGGAREGAGRPRLSRRPGRPRRVDASVPPIFAQADGNAAGDAGGGAGGAAGGGRPALSMAGGPSVAWRVARTVRGEAGSGSGGEDDGGGGGGGVGVVSVNPVNAARIAQLEVETALKHVELRVKQAELLEREEVVRVWSKLLQTLAERLGGVASACSADLLSLFGAVDGAMRSRVEEIIGREVERARAVVAEEPFGVGDGNGE